MTAAVQAMHAVNCRVCCSPAALRGSHSCSPDGAVLQQQVTADLSMSIPAALGAGVPPQAYVVACHKARVLSHLCMTVICRGWAAAHAVGHAPQLWCLLQKRAGVVVLCASPHVCAYESFDAAGGECWWCLEPQAAKL